MHLMNLIQFLFVAESVSIDLKMLSIIVFVFTAGLTYAVHKWFAVWRFSEKFPGPATLPFLGNALQLGTNPYDYLQNTVAFVKHYKFQAFRTWIGSRLMVIVTDPKDVELLLSNDRHMDKLYEYRFLHDWLGNGLITSKGIDWQRQRRALTPTFHFSILHDYHEIMISNLDRLTLKLNSYADSGEAFDVQELLHLVTLDIICETAMGVQINALNDPDSDLVRSFHDISAMVFRRFFSSWKRFDLLFPLSADYQTHHKAVKTLRSFNDNIITQRRAKLLSEMQANTASSHHKRKVFLDMLLTTNVNGVPLTDQEINDQVSTFITAGHHTTAFTIACALYNMSIHVRDQQAVFDEQAAIFGKDLSRKATYQELQEMKLMDRFIKESQRMYPTVPLIGRRANEGLVLSGGRVVPEGTSVVILLFAMGMNPQVFKNPEQFDTNRFLPENRTARDTYSFVPFSAGPRNCIGQKFAYNEMNMILGHIVRHFVVLPPERPTVPRFAITATTHSENGLWIRLKKRE